MARILEQGVFTWNFVDRMPDITRIRLVLDNLPDEELMLKLERKRKCGRDDYPVRAMWNLVVTYLLTGHVSWASHLRELRRNRDLAQLCGFAPFGKLPRPHNLSRFLTRLLAMQEELHSIFMALVKEVGGVLPELGKRLAVDSKAIRSYAVVASEKLRNDGLPDARGEHDAAIGKKSQFVEKSDGTVEEQLYEWFGFKLHLMVDSNYQLPVAFLVTKGLEADTSLLKPLLKQWKEAQPELSARTNEVSADKAYDDHENHLAARELGAQFLCPTRNLWKNPDGKTKDAEGKVIFLKYLAGSEAGHIAYDQDGQLYCAYREPHTEQWGWRPMVFKGYEADREALKYVCPARAYGCGCRCAKDCPTGLPTTIRVKLHTEPRIFTQTPRHTLKFKRLYKHRTAVERVNGILDNVLGIEWHTMRGIARVRLRVTLSLCAMLAMALGRVRANQTMFAGSLTRAA